LIVKKNISDEKIGSIVSREEKLKRIMELYGNDVMKIAFIYLKKKQMAEDVTQDVFLKCYENLDGFRNESAYKTWIFRITVNRCKDILKSWSYKNLYLTEFFHFRDSEYYRDNDVYLDESEFISKKVLLLPVKLREVIILFYYEELSIEEIADMLKLNSNTVKTRLHRGRQKLKKFFKEGENNG
jgi:RNA polymerase sigma factor (sigma-70 family)